MPQPAPPNNASALEELRQKLYANAAPPSFPAPSSTAQIGSTPNIDAWQEKSPPAPKKKVAWSVLFLIGALVIFAGALGTAAYFLVFGGGAISTDHVSISVAPLPSLRSGDVATLLVTVKNENPTTISSTHLSIVFPESTRSVDDPLLSYPRYDEELADIAPGASVTRTVRAVLSGAEGEVLTLPLKLEYKTEGSNATFVKEETHEVVVTSSPLSLRVSVPAQATAGQEIALQVVVHSDASVPMENIVVSAEYPFGFVPAKTGLSTTLFEVGTLAPGKDATVTVRGTLTGEDTDERVFRFAVGSKGVNGLGLTYATGQGSVMLSHPFLSTTLAINSNSGADIVIPSSQSASGQLQWVNTLASDIVDAQILVKLTGEALDVESVSASGGFFRSVDSTLVFSRDTSPGLARLAPNASGNGSFSFSTKSREAMQRLRNPAITATITISGRTSKSGNAPVSETATVTRTIQVATDLGVTVRSSRLDSTFKNTGPIPPQPNVESTYTILMDLNSSVNSVAGAAVKGTLPPYVRFVGPTSPTDGSITYDSNTRVVTFLAGEVPAGGVLKRGAFQVALLPSTSQRGTSPVLMSAVSYTGTDRFTKRLLEGSLPSVSTQTMGDAGYQGTQGEVIR